MGRAEGTVRQQWMAGIRQTCDRPDLCGFQRLLPGHVRQNRGQAAGQHAFASAGAADKQQVVTSCGGYFQSAAAVFLTHHIPQIRCLSDIVSVLPGDGGRETLLSFQMAHQGLGCFCAVYGQSFSQSGFGGIFGGHIKCFYPGTLGGHSHRQHTAHRAQRASQG